MSNSDLSTATSPEMHVASDAGDDIQMPLPVWLRESSKSFYWRWVPVRMRQMARNINGWSRGPDPVQIQRITPWFPLLQETIPIWIENHFPKRRQKALLLLSVYCAWLLTFTFVLNHSARASVIKGYGKPQSIWCGATFWEMKNGCGLNGNQCRPFENATLAFRCPANCRSVKVLAPHAVGRQEISYQPFVIGGPLYSTEEFIMPGTMYRADSFICQAAIHSGLVSNDAGGCGVALLTGEQSNFTSTEHHGIQSLAFDSSFPKSFTFVSDLSSQCVSDLRWPLLAVTVGFTTILSLSTTSAAILYPSIFTMSFFHVGLVSDPPNQSDYASLFSIIIGRFLPAAFVAYVIYHSAVEPQQTGLTATVERTLLWLGGIWIGCLNNYTFDHIPIQRLTPTDIRAQSGAYLALTLIVLIIFAIAIGQAWYLRLEGRLRRFIALYTVMGTGLTICIIVPQLHLRIHHYVLALLLLPGTRLQTRPSLLYQGILLGLFINGVARWGFDSIMQTPNELREDGQLGSRLPNITATILGTSNITFAWDMPPTPFDGLSVLMNDVEMHRWYNGEGDPEVTFERHIEGLPEYFRFGYMHGSAAEDFTKAGTWNADGSWRTMEEGASR